MAAKKNGRKRRNHASRLIYPKFVFEDDDVERVLKAMGSNYSLGNQEQVQLKQEINRCLAFSNKCYQHHDYHAPHKVIDYCKRIQVGVAKIAAVLQEVPNVRYELAKEADRFPPCSSKIRRSRRPIPSELAHAEVTEAELAVNKIALWARHRERWAIERSTRVGKRRVPDHIRYRLVLCYAHIFTVTFGKAPSATLGGPWCLFLKELLNISEGGSLGIDGVHDLWSEVRSWRDRFRGRPMPEDDFAWIWTT
jgi:hypothetical protein